MGTIRQKRRKRKEWLESEGAKLQRDLRRQGQVRQSQVKKSGR